MSGNVSLRLGVVSFALFILIAFSFFLNAYADPQCPAGTVAITDATRATATLAGIPTSAACWNPNDPNTGQTAGNAKAWLAQHAIKSANISCLNPQFAEKLEKLMQAVPGGPPVITYGYRTIADQNKAISQGPSVTRVTNACQSYHVYGLAADFNNNNNAQTAWMRANANQFGVNTIGVWDPNHFQDASGISGQCGACDNNAAGDGTLPNGAGAAPTPSSSLANTIRNIFNPQPVPPAPVPVQSAPTTPTSYATVPTTATTPISNLLTSATGSTATVGPTVATSAVDLLEALANPQATTTATGTPVQLNANENVAAQIQSILPVTNVGSGGSVVVQPQVSQTFTSGDLNGGGYTSYVPGQTTTFEQMLGNIKNVLLGMLSYLQPFGGNVPGQVVSE